MHHRPWHILRMLILRAGWLIAGTAGSALFLAVTRRGLVAFTCQGQPFGPPSPHTTLGEPLGARQNVFLELKLAGRFDHFLPRPKQFENVSGNSGQTLQGWNAQGHLRRLCCQVRQGDHLDRPHEHLGKVTCGFSGSSTKHFQGISNHFWGGAFPLRHHLGVSSIMLPQWARFVRCGLSQLLGQLMPAAGVLQLRPEPYFFAMCSHGYHCLVGTSSLGLGFL